jgi:hypothetical protein
MPRSSIRRQVTAVLAAVASLVIGAVLLRFLRPSGDARTRREVAKQEIAKTPHGGGELQPQDPQRLQALFARIEDNSRRATRQ